MMNFSVGFWDLLYKLWMWFKTRKAEQRAEEAEREVLNVETVTDQKTDVDQVHTEHEGTQDAIQDLQGADAVADSFNKL